MIHAMNMIAATTSTFPLPSVGGNLAATLTSTLSTIGNSVLGLLQSLFN